MNVERDVVERDVAAFDDLTDGASQRFEVDGEAIAIVRIGDDVYAIGDTCTHANVSLSDGEVWCAERQLECPRHGAAFDLCDGSPTSLPATQPVPVYPVAVVDGRVIVTVDAPPGGGDSE